jgi:hypothetical protein
MISGPSGSSGRTISAPAAASLSTHSAASSTMIEMMMPGSRIGGRSVTHIPLTSFTPSSKLTLPF